MGFLEFSKVFTCILDTIIKIQIRTPVLFQIFVRNNKTVGLLYIIVLIILLLFICIHDNEYNNNR